MGRTWVMGCSTYQVFFARVLGPHTARDRQRDGLVRRGEPIREAMEDPQVEKTVTPPRDHVRLVVPHDRLEAGDTHALGELSDELVIACRDTGLGQRRKQ